MATSRQWQLAHEAAERYEHILVPAILGPFAQALVEWSALQPDEVVVDIGTGAAARFAAERVGPAGRAIGIDVNGGMIDVPKARTPQGAPIDWYQKNARYAPGRWPQYCLPGRAAGGNERPGGTIGALQKAGLASPGAVHLLPGARIQVRGIYPISIFIQGAEL
ncbi:MAG: hypothetical protein KJ077_04575 [Anaerolineae bacterium]|nr:hypothetical protein [Anaerolineae bacterium]